MVPSTLLHTFTASMKSIGTVCTMVAVGIYLHHRGIVGKEGKRTLSLITQQVTVPLYLFTKILYCNQDWSDKPCPDIAKALGDVWILFIWPIYVVGIGLIVGMFIAKITKTPTQQIRAVIAACAFGNSNGLPITLLTVVHESFPSTSDLGRIDPTLFLSVYLLLYPALQWGIGGWLLTPTCVNDEKSVTTPNSICMSDSDDKHVEEFRIHHGHGRSSMNGCIYVSELEVHDASKETDDFEKNQWLQRIPLIEQEEGNSCKIIMDQSEISNLSSPDEASRAEMRHLFVDGKNRNVSVPDSNGFGTNDFKRTSFRSRTFEKEVLIYIENSKSYLETIVQTLRIIVDRCLQPPVIASIVAIIAAVTPIRGYFVDIVHRGGQAPLQWLFDGLYSIGRVAVPMNMMILGCNLVPNKKATSDTVSDGLFSIPTMVGIVIGKMVILPMIGVASAFILRKYILDIPPSIGGSFYLVIMIVFLCPSASNLIIMVELSESKANAGVARVIALQYALAPLILGATMTVAVGVASNWS